MNDSRYRTEHDSLGTCNVPIDALYGIHTVRARQNFTLTGKPVHTELIHAYGTVKQACAMTNESLGVWNDSPDKGEAIIRACGEVAAGLHDAQFPVDLLQGGAGTSMNMNANEVIANRALILSGREAGDYSCISPLDDVNRHQSTNDTYPTALRLAAIRRLHRLEERVVALQEAFQAKEKEFAHIVKVGRTQYQDAVLTTLGREMASYAEAFNRDRWRIYKCEERLRLVNLGGTAIGTGIAAPRRYIFQVVDVLRDITGIGFARAENLVEATQNQDTFVEVSGILKACATNLFKVCSDLRLLSSGPESGLGEIHLPPCQAGSSVMPGKVNPVIPEASSQAALLVMAYDQTISMACANGSLELNPFLPLVSACLLESIDLLSNGCDILRRLCVEGIQADEERCQKHVESSTALVTALLPALGYEETARIAERARTEQRTIREICLTEEILNEETFNSLISPEAICRLGMP